MVNKRICVLSIHVSGSSLDDRASESPLSVAQDDGTDAELFDTHLPAEHIVKLFLHFFNFFLN